MGYSLAKHSLVIILTMALIYGLWLLCNSPGEAHKFVTKYSKVVLYNSTLYSSNYFNTHLISNTPLFPGICG